MTDLKYFAKELLVCSIKRGSLDHKWETRNCPVVGVAEGAGSLAAAAGLGMHPAGAGSRQ